MALAVAAILAGGMARAQNLDQGKSPARLFADGCASCHHSPRHLAKDRFRLQLFLFLQQHYATSSSSAWELSSYLESVDGPPGGRVRTAAAKHRASSTRSPHGSLRPPMPVPQR
ncbi:MAG: hypothetical protein JOY90_29675 [Bradyrhizobium sp.]|nr:hypothetical protein [Bradyrhizobium sp.]